MALEKFSIFRVHNFHFLSAEFPFFECRFLGGLYRAPLQFLHTKFAFSEHRIIFSECRILGGVLKQFWSAKFAFLECRISICLVQNFDLFSMECAFSEHGISIFLSWNSGQSAKGGFECNHAVNALYIL